MEKPILYRICASETRGGICPARFWIRKAVPESELQKYLDAGWIREKSDRFDGQFGPEAEKYTIV